jgi:DNA-binding response OmpR family regulator
MSASGWPEKKIKNDRIRANAGIVKRISMTTAVKSAISPFAQLKAETNANAILFIDEQPASMPGAGISEDFHNKLSQVFSVIVLVATSAVEDEVTRKKQAPNTSLTNLNDTRNVRLPLDEEKVWLSFNDPDMFEFGGVKGCLSTREIYCCGRPVTLTSKEFKTLAYLIKNPRRVISRDELLNEVWGYQNYPCTRTVDNHILRLRKKLESEPAHPKHFHTVHCAGYRFLP